MAQLIDSGVRNAGARLRDDLDMLERLAVKPDAKTVESLLTSLDAVEQEMASLEDDGLDLRSERVRWGNLTDRLQSRPNLIARAASGLPGGLSALRARHAPATGFWWHADEVRARRLRRAWTESLAIVAGVAIVLVVGYWLFTWLFPPDPRAVAVVRATADIQAGIGQGDWDAALEAAETALAAWPDDPELAIWVGVLATHTGDEARSAEALAAARSLLSDTPSRYWLLLSSAYQDAGSAEDGMAAADEALALAPDDPEANFIKGKAAMLLGDRAMALEYLDRTYTLASDANPALAVNARVLWSEMIQTAPMLPDDATAPPTLPASP